MWQKKWLMFVMPCELQHTLENFLKDYGLKRTYWVAYSGGLDSHVLLHLCVSLRELYSFPLRAIHINHSLSPRADEWTEHCARVCEKYQVDFTHRVIAARPPAGESLENYARQKRYAVLAEVLKPDDMLLTAQHQDDQAETLLLQLLRGAGTKGLSSMPQVKTWAAGFHGRPLLDITRKELQTYAESNQLQWVEDESNTQLHYSRNFIRHEILPLLRKKWPTITATLARTAENCAEAQQLLEEVANHDLPALAGSKPHTLSVKRLLELSPTRQRLILRTWFEQQGALMPNAAKLQQIQHNVLLARQDSMPCVIWGKTELRRYQDDVYVMAALSTHNTQQVFPWEMSAPLPIPGIGTLEAIPGSGLRAHLTNMEVRFRRGGEVYSLPNGQHHELKKFFQEQAIPPWVRNRLPLIFVENELAAIPGLLVVDKFKTASAEPGYELIIQY